MVLIAFLFSAMFYSKYYPYCDLVPIEVATINSFLPFPFILFLQLKVESSLPSRRI